MVSPQFLQTGARLLVEPSTETFIKVDVNIASYLGSNLCVNL